MDDTPLVEVVKSRNKLADEGSCSCLGEAGALLAPDVIPQFASDTVLQHETVECCSLQTQCCVTDGDRATEVERESDGDEKRKKQIIYDLTLSGVRMYVQNLQTVATLVCTTNSFQNKVLSLTSIQNFTVISQRGIQNRQPSFSSLLTISGKVILCDVLRRLPRVFESNDCWTKFDSVLHNDNDKVLYGVSVINMELVDCRCSEHQGLSDSRKRIRSPRMFWLWKRKVRKG